MGSVLAISSFHLRQQGRLFIFSQRCFEPGVSSSLNSGPLQNPRRRPQPLDPASQRLRPCLDPAVATQLLQLGDHLPTIFTSLGFEYDDKVLPSIGNEVLKVVVAQFLTELPRGQNPSPASEGDRPKIVELLCTGTEFDVKDVDDRTTFNRATDDTIEFILGFAANKS